MIARITTTLALLLCLQIGIAQDAPDIDVTDSDGERHRLYSNYLNQGKTVLVKLFYSACPPCISIAPSLQELYEEWGAGEHDVEFIELSIQNWETDATVNTYKNNHGVTFPSVSNEGGSVSAANDFIDGDFGPYFGTPTFIVVAPDGSVNWDVDGFGNAGTIEALDEALLATGAEKPSATSVNDPATQVFFRIAPNPSSHRIHVDIQVEKPSEIDLRVYDILGKEIEQVFSGYQSNLLAHYHKPVAHWRSGTYFVKVQVDGRLIRTVPFVKS